ncbi:hydantoinase/oxoprolinase family protein [Luteitalea sp. TBR-22]|uniref:hydantoinase/oxoprolinase family protein n=1 Tax=Luteitalea sp. TBR-22 TaxID=2802971 RepID=UPI00351D4F40
MVPVSRLRIGIDVGGTFTDVVAVDADTFALVAQLKVPTTHHAPEGVARGIVDGLQQMLRQLAARPADVVFIAHSTTQATNALLEGDVARVGIVGAGRHGERWKARIDTRVPPVPLAPGKALRAVHAFAPIDDPAAPGAAIGAALDTLQAAGVEVIVASEPFAVDDPSVEVAIADAARARGLWATAGHEVASLYGLRTRTRTALLNAAVLPRMVGTATMTARSVEEAGIAAPLMIMRSDGGVMTVDEVARRPIQTMLSGPAAGIAGALMHEQVSDGIFIEVGGTSADISVIRDGQPQMRPARVGGHRTFLNTLDVRTLAIAGGSMVRVSGGALVDVGPRSAHIAGVGYACFAPAGAFDGPVEVTSVCPLEGDPADYVVLVAGGARYALTPTCAANAAGVVPADAFAKADRSTAERAFAVLAASIGQDGAALARAVLDRACGKVVAQVRALVEEYRLSASAVDLVGGGGGAASLVPHTGALMGVPWRLARQAEVISPLGVALAMVRDTIERTIVDPTPADVLRVRQEAVDAAVRNGALAETIDVQVEVDARRNLVRAVAAGSAELRRGGAADRQGDATTRRAAAARSMHRPVGDVRVVASTAAFDVFAGEPPSGLWWAPWRHAASELRVVDATGVVRLQRQDATVRVSTASALEADLRGVLDALADFGDAGRTIPDVHLLVGPRIVNLAGLADEGQILGLAAVEVRGREDDAPVVIIATARR